MLPKELFNPQQNINISINYNLGAGSENTTKSRKSMKSKKNSYNSGFQNLHVAQPKNLASEIYKKPG